MSVIKHLHSLSLVLFSSFILTACSSEEGSEQEPTASFEEKIANPKDYSSEQLIEAYDNVLSASYTGSETDAVVNIETAQTLFSEQFGGDSISYSGLSFFDYEGQLNNGNVDEYISCPFGGGAELSGNLDLNGSSTLSLTYLSCNLSANVKNLNGEETLKFETITEEKIEFTQFINEVTFEIAEESYSSSGYVEVLIKNQISNTGKLISEFKENVLVTSSTQQKQIYRQAEYAFTFDYWNYTGEFQFDATVFDSELGKVTIEHYELDGAEQVYQISGDGTVRIGENENGYMALSVDADGDGAFELATYITSLEVFISTDIENIVLVSPDQLTLPPEAGAPYVIGYGFYTTDSISVEPGYYSDEDTELEDLSISYRWYVNDELVVGEYSNTLPPFTAVFGDTLQVTMVVSDGANLTESWPRSIQIEDSPSAIMVKDLNENIQAGELVSFTVEILDPDIRIEQDSETSVDLTSAPDGASINEQGLVTWQTPTSLLFPQQAYRFVFSNPSNEIESLETSVYVNSSAAMPIVRSGIEVPYINYSTWVGDFNGDNKNEVLSTDSNSRVYLLSESNGKYSQSWMYPFALPSKGEIKQVIATNTDADDELEIIVITALGISLIGDLNSVAELVLEDKYIHFAAVADSDLDGQLELAYLVSSSEYGDNKTLKVIELEAPNTALLTSSFNDVREIVFANVDEDEVLELVTNSGLVFDGLTWQNQWLYGEQFGQHNVGTGDFDGDGIDEIVAADHWDNISVYSAQTKEKLLGLENFNTCSVGSSNVDNDLADEIIVSDCQWGTVRAYDYSPDGLVELWSIDMQGNDSKSVAVGDSDNDGQLEVHWGTGQGSSGADQFVIADVTDGALTLKDKSIQLMSYSNAGWSQSNADLNGVFFVPESDSGDGRNSRIFTINPDGSNDISAGISSNWDFSRYAAVTDFNNDGEGDIFLPTTVTYDGSFSAIQLNDLSTHWKIEGDYSDTIGVIDAYDINADGYDDALYVNGSVLNAIDIENQVIIFSHDFEREMRDFTMVTLAEEFYVVAATSNSTHLIKADSSISTELHKVDESCLRVEFGNFDQDEELEIACLYTAGYWSHEATKLNLYDITDDKLELLSSFDFPYYALDLAVDTSTASEQALFITTQTGDSYYDEEQEYKLVKFSSKGKVLWSSPNLVGKPSHRGLKHHYDAEKGQKLLLSTNKAAYYISQE